MATTSAVEVDPCPGLPVMDVGSWSLEKHSLLRRYVDASREARRKYRVRTFIDLYCGPGRVRNRDDATDSDGGALIAWRESARTRTQFTHVVIGDLEPQSLSACRERLAALGASVVPLAGPAESTADEVVARLPMSGLHLAYLDPFNLGHLPFSVIERLSRFPRIDIVVHFSVMDLQREIELDFDRDASRFEAFAPGWREHIDVRSLNKVAARARFVEYWLGLVEKLGFKCSRERPLLTNSRNGPLYRMMFLLRHPLAERLWNDIAKSDQLGLFD